MRDETRPGTLVVIEGPDASGKETQTGRIVEWLRDKEFTGISNGQEEKILRRMPGKYPTEDSKVKDSIESGVWRLSFPTYSQTPGGRVVKAYLDGKLGERDDLDVETIVDIYAADRKQFKELIAEYLEKGGIIVCDRYREANLIHQLVGFSGKQWGEKFEEIKSVDEDLPDAEEVFYLDISPEEAERRMKDREKDIHELDEDYLRKSNRNGRKVAEKEGWSTVDGERPMDEVTRDLKSRIRQFLDQP